MTQINVIPDLILTLVTVKRVSTVSCTKCSLELTKRVQLKYNMWFWLSVRTIMDTIRTLKVML